MKKMLFLALFLLLFSIPCVSGYRFQVLEDISCMSDSIRSAGEDLDRLVDCFEDVNTSLVGQLSDLNDNLVNACSITEELDEFKDCFVWLIGLMMALVCLSVVCLLVVVWVFWKRCK